jgi:hypothetical protein
MLDLGSTSMSLALAPAGMEEFPSGQKGGGQRGIEHGWSQFDTVNGIFVIVSNKPTLYSVSEWF